MATNTTCVHQTAIQNTRPEHNVIKTHGQRRENRKTTQPDTTSPCGSSSHTTPRHNTQAISRTFGQQTCDRLPVATTIRRLYHAVTTFAVEPSPTPYTGGATVQRVTEAGVTHSMQGDGGGTARTLPAAGVSHFPSTVATCGKCMQVLGIEFIIR